MPAFTQSDASRGKGEWCVFRTGEQDFCLPTADVVEIVFFPRLTSLPRAPRQLLGIADLQIPGRPGGAAVLVVDVRQAHPPDDDSESRAYKDRHEWKYAIVATSALSGEAVLLAIAAEAVWYATAAEGDDLLGPLFGDPASPEKPRTLSLNGVVAKVLDVASLSLALHQAAVA